MGRGARRARVINTGPDVLLVRTIAPASAVGVDVHDVACERIYLNVQTEDMSACVQAAIGKEHERTLGQLRAKSK